MAVATMMAVATTIADLAHLCLDMPGRPSIKYSSTLARRFPGMSFASSAIMLEFSSRREFCLLATAGIASALRAASSLSLAGPLGGSIAGAPGAIVPDVAPRTVRIGVLGSAGYGVLPGAADARDGLALGADEAARTAALFGLTVQFVHVLFSDEASHRAGRARHARASEAARSLVNGGAVALCAAAAPADAAEIARVAAGLEVPFVDLLSPPDAAPAAGIDARGGWTFHVAPSRRARAVAVLESAALRYLRAPGEWALLASTDSLAAEAMQAVAALTPTPVVVRAAAPSELRNRRVILLAATPQDVEAQLALVGLGATPVVVDLFGAGTDPRALRADAWHAGLERYGAAQLNDRYRARFGASAAMSGAAWAGWFAAKAIVEAALRTPDATAASIRERLLALRFDGHQGIPLYFAPDGALQQPLHVRDGDR